MKTSIEDAMSAARAMRAHYPACRVNFSVTLQESASGDLWSGDSAGHLFVDSPDPSTRALIAKACGPWTFHCPIKNVFGVSALLTGSFAGVEGYLEVPAQEVTFDAEAYVTCDADGTSESAEVVVTAIVVTEALSMPAARVTRLLDVERGRDLLDDVKSHDGSRHASWAGSGAPRAVEPKSQVAELERMAVAAVTKAMVVT